MKLTQGLRRSAQLKANHPATIFGARQRTWAELKDRVARLASGLVSLGLEPGDRVATLSLNSDRYIEAYFAIWWAGGVIVPGNNRWTLAEHRFALADTGPELLLVDRTFAEIGAELAIGSSVKAVVYLDEGAAPRGMIASESLVESFGPMVDACAEDDALAAVFYTGGTTGQPKGVMLSHRSLMSNFLCSTATSFVSGDAIFLHSAPMFHLADASVIVGITMVGGTHAIIPSFIPAAFAEAVATYGVTDVVAVPTMFAMLREHADVHPTDFSSVVRVTYGASPISEMLLHHAMELFPKAAFRQGYGQTELSPTVTLLTDEFHRTAPDGKSYLRSAGRPLVGIDIKIVDDHMVERDAGQVGEIVVYSPGAMLGYWNRPELTRRTLVEGWVRTGDAGYVDEDGFLFLVDRVKDMILSGGENVFSAEVENALSAHPDVAECAVIGVPDERWGERVHALVRLTDGATHSAEDVIVHCRSLIAAYKCPKTIEFRAEPLPLSAVGKVLKSELRKPYWPDDGRRIN